MRCTRRLVRSARLVAFALIAATSEPGSTVEPPPLPEQPFFNHLTTADGLPEDTVRALLQDRLGFLWIGTQNGLARYDGTEIRVFRPVPGDSTSIGGRAIFALYQDASGCIWAGTAADGLSCFDPRTGIFTNYSSTSTGLRGLPGRSVVGITSTPDSTVWVALHDGGLAHREHPNAPFTRVAIPRDADAPAHTDSVTTLLAARDGTIFVGIAGGGIGRYDPATRTWRLQPPHAGNPSGPRPGTISHILQDRAGRIWLATTNGLALWNPEMEALRWYESRPGDTGEWEDYLIRIAEDEGGRLWIGSAVGLYLFDPAPASFRLFRHDPRLPGSCAPGPVMSVLCDRSGAIWTGGWQSGVSSLDPWETRFNVLAHEESDPGSLDQDAAVSVLEGKDGTLWVGTGGVTGVHEVGRLNRRLRGESTFTRIAIEGAKETRTVLALTEDAKGDLWIGTDRGLFWLLDGTVTAKPPAFLGQDAASLSSVGFYALQFDRAGILWAGSFGRGLFRIDLAHGAVTNYQHDPADPNSLSQNRITRLHCDDSGRIWVATNTAGLNLFDPKTGKFQRFPEPRSGLGIITDFEGADGGAAYVATTAGLFLVHPDPLVAPSLDRACGLADVAIASIVRDASGDLWIHTAKGLFRCSDSGQAQAYGAHNGAPGGEMYFDSCRGTSGQLFFGSKHGLLVVDPQSIRVNPYVPPVVITGLQVNDEPAGPATRGTGGKVFPFVERIVLPFDRNDLRFTFAALQLVQSERNRFRYRLQHDDRDWRGPITQGVANYTNVPPGSYRFEVQVGTSHGNWSRTGASLQVVITPPWWRTPWARAIYVLLAFAAAALVYRLIVQRERIRTALEVQRAETRHLHELDQVKSRFFANISHEFRTPLTLILGPLGRLRESANGEARTALNMIDRNARRLSELIEQLLDLSRLEAGRMTVRWQGRDAMTWLQSLVSSFDSLATDRRIALTTQIPKEPLQVWFAPDLLEKIVVNVLANALKFTPPGGEVRVAVEAGGVVEAAVPHGAEEAAPRAHATAREVRITIANTGSYIPPEALERIFERFHQLPEGQATGGTGIGMALTKELVELLGGSIAVESHLDRGTRFTIVLPTYLAAPVPDMEPSSELGLSAPAPEAAASPSIHSVEPDAPATAMIEPETAATATNEHTDARPRLLVVEDNPDLRAFLASELGDVYEVLQAPDGDAGLMTAIEELPDLVLSDVIMPGLDGIELCRRLKTDERTDHIPVILLSARTEVESRLIGLGSGADDYQAKPFDPRELRLRVRNLIVERRRLQERHARQVAQLGPAAMPVTSAQERFLKRAREIIDTHLDEPDFSVEQLAQEIGMSKSQLLRKVRAVTGAAPRDLIRTHRLQRAADFLAAGYGNVTEVSLAVGMESLSSFAKRFREQYGVVPSEYAPAGSGDPPGRRPAPSETDA